jgi:hypothetical protein
VKITKLKKQKKLIESRRANINESLVEELKAIVPKKRYIGGSKNEKNNNNIHIIVNYDIWRK